MPRKRLLQMIVCVSAPSDMRVGAALAEVRDALRNSDPGELALFTVSPIPRNRYVRKRRSPTKREPMPLFDFGAPT